MKRSEINHEIEHAQEFLSRHHFFLPPFAHWSPSQWQKAGLEANEIRSRKLGWDVADFGSGNFRHTGLTLFTLRNGLITDPANVKTYAEKLLITYEEQILPMHFHWQKTEDIINRGTGVLVIQLCNADRSDESKFADTPVLVSCDGILREISAGGLVELGPGESITLTPYLYHAFWAKKGSGTALIGEVSSVNDDATDNRFHESLPRYPKIEEDAPPVRYLCNEYPPAASR